MKNEKETKKKRIRGVQASPSKLRSALSESGLKSQTQVAQRIQQAEKADKLPRSLVNRVFSGETVDPISIERVAKALNVKAWDLYLDSSEFSELESENIQNTEDPKELEVSSNQELSNAVYFPKWIIAGLVVITISMLASFAFIYINNSQHEYQETSFNIDVSNKSVLIIPLSGAGAEKITLALEKAVSAHSSYLAGSASLLSKDASISELLAKNRVDTVISGEIKEIGNFLAVRVFQQNLDSSRTIWAGSFSKFSTQEYVISLFEAVFNGSSQSEPVDWKTVQDVLNASADIQGIRTTMRLAKAVNSLSAIVRKYPKYTEASASLCDLIVEKSILNGNTQLLNDAEIVCKQALSISPDSIPVLTANASLLRKQNKVEEAESLLLKVLQQDANSLPAIRMLAKINTTRFTTTGEKGYFSEAVELLTRGANINPDDWTVPFDLAQVYFFGGNINQAIKENTRAASLNETSMVLSNLGTLNFCAGNLQEAKNSYEKALKLDSDTIAISSNLATVYYYLEEFEKSLLIYQQQVNDDELSSVDTRYQMFINIADSYRQLNNTELATEYYYKALSFLNQQIAKGEASVLQKASRITVQLVLTFMNPSIKSRAMIDSIQSELTEIENTPDPNAIANIAFSQYLIGQTKKADISKAKLGSRCPGFAASPDLTPQSRI
jgi:tetratricopeptide (TPR) repeat protein